MVFLDHTTPLDIVLSVLRKRGKTYKIKYINPEFLKEPEVILAVVSKAGKYLRIASPELRNDEYIVSVAVSNNGEALQYASKELRSNRTIINKALQKNGFAIQYIDPILRRDPEIALLAIRSNNRSYSYIGLNLKNDRNFNLQAVAIKGIIIRYFPEEYRKDREMMRLAIKNRVSVFENIDSGLKEDREFLQELLEDNPSILVSGVIPQIDKSYITQEVAMKLVKKNGYYFSHIPQELHTEELIFIALKYNSLVLRHLSEEMTSNKEFLLRAICCNSDSLQFALTEFKNDRELVSVAVSKRGNSIQYASVELYLDPDIRAIARRQILHNKQVKLQNLDRMFQDDKEIVLCMVSRNGFEVNFASESLKDDMEVAHCAVSQNGFAIRFVSSRCQEDPEIKTIATRYQHRIAQRSDMSRILKNIRQEILEISSHREYNSITKLPLALIAICRSGFNIHQLSDELKTHPSIINLLQLKTDPSNKSILFDVVNAGIPLTEELHNLLQNAREPLILQDLGGNNYTVRNWLTCDNIIALAQEQYSEIGSFDIYLNDRLFSEMELIDAKKSILYSSDFPEAMIVYR